MRKIGVIRIRVITAGVLVLALVLLGRLYQLQVLQHDVYAAKGEEQYVHTVDDLFTRGGIFFTTKDGETVSAATVQSGFVLAVDPTAITDPDDVYAQIDPFIDTEKETFHIRATLPNRTYVVIDERITEKAAKTINKKNIPGVQLYKNQWRYYPGDSLAARTVGFIGYRDGKGKEDERQTGLYGLERFYNHVLRRDTDGFSVNFFAEIFSGLGELVFESDTKRRGDVVTSIEPTVARMLQSELKDTNNKWNSKITGGIVMDPQTGEIVALDAVPTFNLNDRSGATIGDFKNPLVENVYEFGSIVKALTMAAGLDSGAVTPETTYYDAGSIERDDFTIHNFDGRGRGQVDMQEVLNQSLNTGAAYVAETMGKAAFREYFFGLKLGSETGIDLPNEAFGLIDNLNSPRDVEYATASFGQGIATTPIAIVRALATLGNGGTLVTPHIATRIEYQDGMSKEITYPEGDRVFSKETSEKISRMLTVVVDEALGGGDIEFERYSVAAKTGTAQIADQQGGGYYEDRYLHSFFGYFPSYDPEFLVFLYTLEPKGARYASETLTDPFMNITEFLINYYNIPPDR